MEIVSPVVFPMGFPLGFSLALAVASLRFWPRKAAAEAQSVDYVDVSQVMGGNATQYSDAQFYADSQTRNDPDNPGISTGDSLDIWL